jgi:hypothetical protein
MTCGGTALLLQYIMNNLNPASINSKPGRDDAGITEPAINSLGSNNRLQHVILYQSQPSFTFAFKLQTQDLYEAEFRTKT